MNEIVVVGVATAKEGKEAELEEVFRRTIRKSQAEEGNVRYALHRGTNNPRTFVIVERWASQAALDEHFTTPQVAELMQAVPELVEGPVVIEFAEPLPEGDPVKGLL